MKKKLVIALSCTALLTFAACGPNTPNEGGSGSPNNATVDVNNVESGNATGSNFRNDMIDAMNNVISNHESVNSSGSFRNDMVDAMDNVISNDNTNGTGSNFRNDMINSMDNVISNHNDVNVTDGSFRNDMINAMDNVMGR